MRHPGAARIAVETRIDAELRELPRFIRVPGERLFVDLGQPPPTSPVRRSRTGRTAKRHDASGSCRPLELPLDARAELVVEPGLESAEGTEAGDEDRVAVVFQTFPELGFWASLQRHRRLTDGRLRFDAGAGGCNPLAGVGFRFSAPVLASEIKERLTIAPDLAAGRTDYDPWANLLDCTLLSSHIGRDANT